MLILLFVGLVIRCMMSAFILALVLVPAGQWYFIIHGHKEADDG